MPPKKYSRSDLERKANSEGWKEIRKIRDSSSFSDFVSNSSSKEGGGLSSHALEQLRDLLPEVEETIGSEVLTIVIAEGPKEYHLICMMHNSSCLVWSLGNLPPAPNQTRSAQECFRRLAELAAAEQPEARLRLPEQRDSAYMWKASSVHPLQTLENAYQRIVHEAGSVAEEDSIKAQSDTLARFFIQDVGTPQFLKSQIPTDADNGGHLAAVKMNHLIDSFYLFRLLVQYQVESHHEVSDDLRVGLSGSLTKLLHNGDRASMGWLSAWLTEKIADLGARVRELDSPGNQRVIFFLKGGRALNYFLGTPEKGENDWDTQIVIDPRLPAEEWYDCLGEVHDLVLGALQDYRAEFTALVERNAGPFSEYLDSISGLGIGQDEEIDENETSDINSRRQTANCKAELIDIGLPRRDSASALEEWTHLTANDALQTSVDGVVFPHRAYYLNEYLMMVRDAFLPHADVKKAPKRIARFRLILESGNGQTEPSAVDARRIAALPMSAGQIAALESRGRRELFGIMAAQFVEAYNLIDDSDLAALFDEEFLARILNPPELPAALAGLLDGPQIVTATDVGVAHALAELMTEHWQRRHQFFVQQLPFFTDFVRDLARLTNQDLKQVQSQFALGGSFAARLHADHLRLTPVGLEPIRRVLVKLQCERGMTPTAPLRAIRSVIAETAEATGKFRVVNATSGEKESLLLFWNTPLNLGRFTYAPLVMKIRGAAQTGSQLPVLSSIDGMPTLDLRYLAADYLKKTSKIDERGARRVLAAATSAVSEMMSRFDFESDDVG